MERAMMRFALFLTPFYLAWMVYDAIDRALAPYVYAFYAWGGPVVFLILLISALYQRRASRPKAASGQGKALVPLR
jgi:predicted branched-subunit amino acid permease